jgi:hypothetical protein
MSYQPVSNNGVRLAHNERKQHTMEDTIIRIHEHLRADVVRIEILRAHYIQQLQALGVELRTLLQHGHGVDIAQPGWRLDAAAGVLAHVPDAPDAPDDVQQQPVPAQAQAALHVVPPAPSQQRQRTRS